jgi:hypothetical protein
MLLYLGLALSSLATGPALKDGYFTDVADGTYNFLVFKMDFDQNIYMKNNTTITPLANLLQPSPSTGYPMLAHSGIGIIY